MKKESDIENNQKVLIDRIVKNSRLSLLGQMTAGLNHELKNPLSVIRLKIDMMVSALEECSDEVRNKMTPHIQMIEKNVQKIISITDQIRNLTSSPDETYTKLNINNILSDITALYSRFSEEIKGSTLLHLEASQPEFYGNKQQIEQVFLNLIQNSYESFKRWGQGSSVTIRTRNQNNDILVDVLDDGIGVSQKTRAEIFNPFFSTKEDGSGMGLGLTTVEKIIHNHGGAIQLIESTSGAHFQITLPHDRRNKKDRV